MTVLSKSFQVLLFSSDDRSVPVHLLFFIFVSPDRPDGYAGKSKSRMTDSFSGTPG